MIKSIALFSFLDGVKTVSQLTGATPVPTLPAVSITTSTGLTLGTVSATTGRGQVNGIATQGVIEKANDCDMFKVTLIAGTR